jgi:hypothetical protein
MSCSPERRSFSPAEKPFVVPDFYWQALLNLNLTSDRAQQVAFIRMTTCGLAAKEKG